MTTIRRDCLFGENNFFEVLKYHLARGSAVLLWICSPNDILLLND